MDRICGILRRDGEPASYKVIQRIMRQKGLKSCHRLRRQCSLTDSRKARGDEYKNLTKNLVIDSPFQVISSDISYIRTGEGFDYLCQIREAIFEYTEVFYNRRRVQKRLGYQSPLTFLNAWQQLHLQSVA